MASTTKSTLTSVLAQAKGKPLVVLLSGHPDPDAIGSALAHRRICEHLGVPATIAHVHPVSRLENRALLKLLDIEMTRITRAEDLQRFEYLSLVDCNTLEPTLNCPEQRKLLTVVDHHQGGRGLDAPYVDIRLDVGAASTIYAEYLEQGLVPFGQEPGTDSKIATALLFGITTDTDGFVLASAADHRAAAFLRPHSDTSVLRRVASPAISAQTMGVLARALTDVRIVRDFALAGVGYVPRADRDAIGLAADFMLRREDIDTVLVYGVVDGRIDGSLRTNSASLDPARFVQTAFGTDEQGRYYGGGRSDKAGFQVPLGALGELHDNAALWALVQQLVEQRVGRVVPEVAELGSAPG